jgi:hypothetical protein
VFYQLKQQYLICVISQQGLRIAYAHIRTDRERKREGLKAQSGGAAYQNKFAQDFQRAAGYVCCCGKKAPAAKFGAPRKFSFDE